MENNTLYKTTIALAGVVQAVSLVKHLAQTGKMNEDAFHSSLYSILQTDPKNIADVFGGLPKIKYGLQQLVILFEHKSMQQETRYLLSLIQLQKKIVHSSNSMKILTQRINQIKKQVDYFSLTHPTVIANLADAYLNTIHEFKHKIIIFGNERILHTAENMEKIRALFLAGIRASVLWRQSGGSRLQLLFSRAKIKATATQILDEIDHL